MRFVSTLLFFLFLYSILGYNSIVFSLYTENAFTMHELLNENNSFQILHIQKSDMAHVVFYDNDEEVSYYGNMYDIKEKKVDGDTITLQCIPDNFETNLLANLCNNILDNLNAKSPNGKKQNNVLKVWVSDFCIHKIKMTFHRNSYTAVHFISEFNISIFSISVHTPPPKNSLPC